MITVNDRVHMYFKELHNELIFDVGLIQDKYYDTLTLMRSGVNNWIDKIDIKKTRFPFPFTYPTYRIYSKFYTIESERSSLIIRHYHNIGLISRLFNVIMLRYELHELTTTTDYSRLISLQTALFNRLDIIAQIQQKGLINKFDDNPIDTNYIIDIVSKFVNNSQLPRLKLINVRFEDTLLHIVNKIYGNTDMFRAIAELNNLNNLNKVKGDLWIYL